ncbi:tyrosine recombinase XerC [Actinoplanes sp. NPDC049265]|uniref:site-specific integrase n=1 Tax=Actinoplanes sp. NPDC049265 TaxID=3363902 RepID=UPI0037157217
MPVSGVFKLCGCREPGTRRKIGRRCHRLGERGHGTWYFQCRFKNLWGHSEQVRRGGFATQAAARQARSEMLEQSCEEFAGRKWTVAQWLRYWLTTRVSIRPTTLHSYTRHVEMHLIPAIGTMKLADVTSRHLTAMFAELARNTTPAGQPRSAGTLQRVRATLRAAYNAAIRDGLVTDNPARRVEMPATRRPHAVVWTEGRVEQWREDGRRPAVAVWTADQLTEFLDFVEQDPLYPLWWLVALRGLRRGEVCGLRWQDVDLDRRQLTISSQRTTVGHEVIEGPPKSAASCRTIALDRRTAQILTQHQKKQKWLYTATGRAWRQSNYVFTRPDGRPYHPNYLTHRLRFLINLAGLPPVRLHDLRHGAATLAHAAGVDLKAIQDQLGHASIVLTADTYTSVLPATHHRAAEATARLILTTARGARAKIKAKNRRRGPSRPKAKPSSVSPANTTPAAQKTSSETCKRHPAPRKGRASTGRRRASKHQRGQSGGVKPQAKRVGRQGLEP